MRRVLLGCVLALIGCGHPVAPLVCVRWESAPSVVDDSTAVRLADVRSCTEYR